jgi:small nuclear ribonucleoprotein (snRNP)-like protein
MVALRDGRKLIGVLRSWDQFGTAMSKGYTKQGTIEN